MAFELPVPSGVQPIIESGPGTYSVRWNPQRQDLVCDVGINNTPLRRLDWNNRLYTYNDLGSGTFWHIVRNTSGTVSYSPSYNPPASHDDASNTDIFDYGYSITQSDNNGVSITFLPGIPPPKVYALSGLKIAFHCASGKDGKDGNTGVEVVVNQGGGKLAGYRQIRAQDGTVVTAGDPEHQQTLPFDGDIVPLGMLLHKSLKSTDDLALTVVITIDPKGKDSWSFYWGLVPVWEGGDYSEVRWPYWWTLSEAKPSASAALMLPSPGRTGSKLLILSNGQGFGYD